MKKKIAILGSTGSIGKTLIKILKKDKKNFEINKFFYRQIGKDHFWRDRLIWTDRQWHKYSSNPLLNTWILRKSLSLTESHLVEII